MTTDTEIELSYARLTEHVPPGPDLTEVLELGRGARRRRTRLRALGALGVAAAVACVAVVAPQLRSGDPVSATPAGPSAHDFVGGTTVDDAMAGIVAAHLPGIGAPRDVYPSDTEHDGPMPDADFASATDWQAEYDVTGADFFRLLMAHPSGGSAYECPSCAWSEVAGGRVATEVSQRIAPDGGVDWRFLVVLESDSGFHVVALEEVEAVSRSAAEAARTFTDAQLLELVQDPGLTFPAPVG